jgi:hypothetical protein
MRCGRAGEDYCEFDGSWDGLYDEADHDRVWIRTAAG